MPKLDIAAIAEENTCGYPAPFHEIARGRFRRRLARAGGLTQFGVNICRLEPGSASSQRHWHEAEDELVYVLDGEVVLVENDGETVMRPGDAAAFKAGVANGHHFVNRATRDALILEIGSSYPVETAHYPDIDLVFRQDSDGRRYTHRSGQPYLPR
jgi:uncharacterized cupin superfamily protein